MEHGQYIPVMSPTLHPGIKLRPAEWHSRGPGWVEVILKTRSEDLEWAQISWPMNISLKTPTVSGVPWITFAHLFQGQIKYTKFNFNWHDTVYVDERVTSTLSTCLGDVFDSMITSSTQNRVIDPERLGRHPWERKLKYWFSHNHWVVLIKQVFPFTSIMLTIVHD